MSVTGAVRAKLLSIDAAAASLEIEQSIQDTVFRKLRRKGVVVGLSGGIDSSTVAALAVRALGPKRVVGLMMPECESGPDTGPLARLLAESLGIETLVEDISPVLRAAGCYRRRDDAIRTVLPQYGTGYKSKIIVADVVGGAAYSIFSVVIESPEGIRTTSRLTLEAYLEVVAANNFKQRTRTMFEYYHADRLSYAVAGTPNRLEYDQGFFVKQGDGAADLKPIAHLYKSQVYEVARYIGIPDEICVRPPTTDTYSLEQSQEEFFFTLPYQQMDLCLYGRDHNIPADEIAEMADLTPEQVSRSYKMIDSRRNAARYLHAAPVLVRETHA